MVRPLKSPSTEELNGWTFDRVFRHHELSVEIAFSLSLIAVALSCIALTIATIAIVRG